MICESRRALHLFIILQTELRRVYNSQVLEKSVSVRSVPGCETLLLATSI